METRVERHGAVAVIERQGRLLIIQRSLTVAAPGAYCFPGGGIEAGENELQALCRELLEELGVAIRPRQRLWSSVTSWGVGLAWWRADLDPAVELAPNPAEVAEVRWLPPRELDDLPGLLSSNLEFLAAWRRGEFELEGIPRD